MMPYQELPRDLAFVAIAAMLYCCAMLAIYCFFGGKP
jgi:hypothetical protein